MTYINLMIAIPAGYFLAKLLIMAAKSPTPEHTREL